jgi:phage tail tape-measure protein
MNDETKPADLWERTKAWADKNRTISGALVGGAAGTVVPWIGTVIGAIVGAGIGFASSKEGIGFASSKEKKEDRAVSGRAMARKRRSATALRP